MRAAVTSLARRPAVLGRCAAAAAAPATRALLHLPAAASSAPAPASAPASASAPAPASASTPASSSNPALAFPCLDKLDTRSKSLKEAAAGAGAGAATAASAASGVPSSASPPAPRRRSTALPPPEPSYTSGATLVHHCREPLALDWGGVLPEFSIAYETWGRLDADGANAILLHTGLSASSHARSTEANPQPGWWERFVGPGRPLDTDRFHVICTNVVGGCYGSTGPGSVDPANGERYATRFPILTVDDMVRAQFRLLDALGVRRLHASVGASMGGMQALAAGVLFPHRVGRVASISGCARSHPYSIAMRYTQRQMLMMDPNWRRGFYYDAIPPHAGMKLAREIATVTYRSGPEWEQRFARRRADPRQPPALCPDFLVETYLDHAGKKWCLEFDPNSLLYITKAMDLFDLGRQTQLAAAAGRRASSAAARCGLTLPDTPYEEQPEGAADVTAAADAADAAPPSQPPSQPPQQQQHHHHYHHGRRQPPPHRRDARPPADLVLGLSPLRDTPTLVMGVASDILFPAWQQREVAESLRLAGSRSVTYTELSEDQSLFGHDTFLLDLENVGGNLGRFLR